MTKVAQQAQYDVVVVGAGNAAMCAALSAREQGASVAVLEWAPKAERGGNTAFTGGIMRMSFQNVDDLRQLTDISEEEEANADFGSYPAEQFFADVSRLTAYRADPDLLELLVDKSLSTLAWMRGFGIEFVPAYGRQSFLIDGKQKFWGGLAVEVAGGGIGLVDSLCVAAEKAGIDIVYGERASSLVTGPDGRISGVITKSGVTETEWRAKSVVLATGGFQANPEWRARYLGFPWDLAKVRGTRFDMGDGIRMALDVGAMPHGNWTGCHAVGWDLNAPTFGDREIGDGFSRHMYQFGLLINADGKRFVDEGADLRNFTYAKYGKVILNQPGQFAWQVFDSKVASLLRPEFYRARYVSKVAAPTLEGLAAKLEGVNPEGFLQTVKTFNDAVRQDVPFDPTTKDGRGTDGLEMPKSNWANTLEEQPFEAFPVTCGITFTFGGVKVTTDGHVLDMDNKPIPGLFAAGEMVGGLFYNNYPGSTGLAWGAVLGKCAGKAAADECN